MNYLSILSIFSIALLMFSLDVAKFNLTLSVANFPKAVPGIIATSASCKHFSVNFSPLIPVPLTLGNTKKDPPGKLQLTPFKLFKPSTISFLLMSNSSIIFFINNNLIGVANKNTTPIKISKEVSPKLVPGKWAIVYVNKSSLPLEDFWQNRRTLYLAHYLKSLSDDQIRARVTNPIERSVMLYALKQYGEVKYITKPLQLNVDHLQEEYEGNLRYILFYLFDEQNKIPNSLNEYQQVYRSREWAVFDLIKKRSIFKSKFDLIFCDPPFKDLNIEKLIQLIYNNNILQKNGIFVLHRHKNTKEKLPNYFKIIDEKIYGISKIMFGKFLS